MMSDFTDLNSWNILKYHDITDVGLVHKGLRVKYIESDEMRACNYSGNLQGLLRPLSHSLQGTMPVSVLRGHSFPPQPSRRFHSVLPLLSFSMYLTDQTLGLSHFELCNAFLYLCRH